MTNEFKKITFENEIRYVLESATGGSSSSAGGATLTNSLGKLHSRLQELKKQVVKVPASNKPPRKGHPTPQTGAGSHKSNQRKSARDDRKLYELGDDHPDHEISMASNELQSIAADAANLLDLVKQRSEEEGLEAWQQSKITKAADFMNSVLQSIRGDEEQGVAEGPEQNKKWRDQARDASKEKRPWSPTNLPNYKKNKEQGVGEGSEPIKIPTEDGITMQDIRLMAGEGKLSQKTIKQAIEVIRKQRRKQGVAESDEPGDIKYKEMKNKIASVLFDLYHQGKDDETIKQMGDRVAKYLGYDPEDSIYQDAWMTSFTDASLDGSLDQKPEDDTDWYMRQGEMGKWKGVEEGPEETLRRFEIYNIRTGKPVGKPFLAADRFQAQIKADDYLEANGQRGRGLGVRPVKDAGVAESDAFDAGYRGDIMPRTYGPNGPDDDKQFRAGQQARQQADQQQAADQLASRAPYEKMSNDELQNLLAKIEKEIKSLLIQSDKVRYASGSHLPKSEFNRLGNDIRELTAKKHIISQVLAQKQGVAEGYSLGKVLPLPEMLDQIGHILTSKHRGIGWKMKKHGDNTFVFSAQNDYNVWSMLVVKADSDKWVTYGNGIVTPEGKSEIFDRQQLPMTLASASEIADEAIKTYHDIDLSDYADPNELNEQGWKNVVAGGALALAALGSGAQTIPNVNAQQVELTNKYYATLVQRAKEDGRKLDTRTLNFLKAKAQDAAALKIQQNQSPQSQSQNSFPSQGSERKVAKDFDKFESQGVAEGGIIKSIKRGLQGWDQNAVGPGGEKLGDPRAVVNRAKAMDIGTAKEVRAGLDDAPEHSPSGLQKRVLDRRLKGAAEGSGPQVGDAVYYGKRLVGWFKGYSKHGKIITEPNVDEMGDEYLSRDAYWDPQEKLTIKPKQGVAEGTNIGGDRFDKVAHLNSMSNDKLNKLIQDFEQHVEKFPQDANSNEYLGLAKKIRAERIGKKPMRKEGVAEEIGYDQVSPKSARYILGKMEQGVPMSSILDDFPELYRMMEIIAGEQGLHMDDDFEDIEASLYHDLEDIASQEDGDEMREGKIKGVDGKACWKGKRYAGKVKKADGTYKDKCVPVSEDAYINQLMAQLESKK